MESDKLPLRVGMVIGQLSTGGAEGQLRLFCERVDRRAVEPTVYCLSRRSEPVGPQLERAGVTVRVIGGSPLVRIARLHRQLAADRVDIVHAWLFVANAYAWVAGGRALVTSARNCKRSGPLLDALNRLAFRSSAAIIANSDAVRRYIQREYGAPAARIAVVYNAVDLDRFRPRAGPDDRQAPRVVTVGRLVAQKNPLLFVAAAAALHKRLPAVRFVWIGDGPLREQVAAAVRAAGLEAVCELAGERADVPELLRSADLFWLTSDWEGLPNAVIEALACGLPVAATRVGGTPELVSDGVEGFLVEPGDGEALVARSLSVLRDAAARRRMGAAARSRSERFGVDSMVRATCAVYDRVLRGPDT